VALLSGHSAWVIRAQGNMNGQAAECQPASLMVNWRGSFLSPAWIAVPIINEPAEAKPQPTAQGPIWWVLCQVGSGLGGGGGATAAKLAPSEAAVIAAAVRRVVRDLRIKIPPAKTTLPSVLS